MKPDRCGVETARPSALRDCDSLDPPAGPSFDAFIHLAAHTCGTPSAYIRLADPDNSFRGCEPPIDGTPCAWVVRHAQPLTVPDLLADDRFKSNPFVLRPPYARFYAAVPLLTKAGSAVGALSVADDKPRPGGWTPAQAHALRMLADQLMTQRHLCQELSKRQTPDQHEDRGRLALLIDQGAVGFLETGLDGRITLANDRYCAIIGRTREQVMASDCLAVTHPDDHQNHRALRADLLRTGETMLLEHRIVRPTGTIVHVKCHYSLLRGHGGHPCHIIAIVQDVSAERASQDALGRLAESLEQRVAGEVAQRLAVEGSLRQVRKMEAVNCLSGGIAHDFNNMLTSMIGNLDLLQARLAEGKLAEAQRFLTGALASAERAGAVSKRLLAFSRRETSVARPTEAGAVIGSMMMLVRQTVGSRITVTWQLDQQLDPILCDPNQLETALMTLVINARESISARGRITIRTRALAIQAEDAHGWGDVRPGSYGSISVTATGAGMVTDMMARASDPFFTTRPAGEETGMGLAMLHSFAHQAGGHVRVQSTPGLGTTVELCLPCATTLRPAGDSAVEEMAASARR